MTRRTLEAQIERGALRTPRAAGIAGIIFAVLLALTWILLAFGIPSEVEATEWIEDSGRRTAVRIALQLIPFAGIAFLWFMGVIRSRIGEREDRFIATVLLGSGLLFVGMMFVSAAVAGGLYAWLDRFGAETTSEVWVFGRSTTRLVTTVYALRMAAVFTLSTTTLAFRLGVIPKWLAGFGYVSALLLLLTSGNVRFVELIFPLWVFLFSVHLLAVPDRAHGEPS
jgi:hypothetical protein